MGHNANSGRLEWGICSNYFVIVPEDCIHASRPEGQQFALSQFRSSAYNFNVSVIRSENIKIAAAVEQRALG